MRISKISPFVSMFNFTMRPLESRKIVARIVGGLGNQIFIYATARRLALVNDAELVLDNVSGFVRDYDYRRNYQLDHFNIPCRKATAAERLEPFPRVRRYLKRRWDQRKPFMQRSYLVQDGIDYDPRLLQFKPKRLVYLEGYWQSENYFKDIEETIRREMQITPPVDAANLEISKQIGSKKTVAVHVRFFDEPDNNHGNNAGGDYYYRAIAEMERRVPDAHYFVFSDRPEAVCGRIPLPDGRITMVNHNQGDDMAYADLWLMSQCEHFIIANSTFSWWGAWLSENSEKVIIAPGFEKQEGKMSWGFSGLLPEDWIKC